MVIISSRRTCPQSTFLGNKIKIKNPSESFRAHFLCTNENENLNLYKPNLSLEQISHYFYRRKKEIVGRTKLADDVFLIKFIYI